MKSQVKKMKKILITGLHSYVGNSIEKYLRDYNAGAGTENYIVDKISLRGNDWKQVSFEDYDTILHVAGIAHADVSSVSKEEQKAYYDVNCNLAKEVAEKAREDGVKQFVYFSSVIIYGDSAGVGKEKIISKDTLPAPANFYGDSKLQGENAVQALETSEFRVAVLRLPMIYGRGSKGNFPILVKLASKMPVFPGIHNQRSMLYIGNLAEFVRLLAEEQCGGVFYPQNEEYVTTAEMVKMIATAKGKKIHMWSLLNPLVKVASLLPGKIQKLANKAFGSLVIERELSEEKITGYRRFSLEESIKLSVRDING